MKKVITTLSALAIAVSLSAPMFAKEHTKKSKEAAATTEQGKAHTKHSKKKGATEGKKDGQQATTPSKQ
ncbi:MAG: hypothetical protein ABSG54_07395 [Terriglobia bacterium]|jgi:uncharacterized protein YxeA